MDTTVPRQGVPRAAVVLTTLVLLVALLAAAAVYFGSRTRPVRPPGLPLGIFEPAAGRIVFQDGGLWAVDPSAPSVSTLVRIGAEGDHPTGWSSDGTKLLVQRKDRNTEGICCPDLFVILHADGTETQLNADALYTYGAAIAPDGESVVFAAGDYRGGSRGLFAIDAEGGQPVQIASEGEAPTFSPDGTRIAYVASGASGSWVVVANADGSGAQVVLASEPALVTGARGGYELAWSPASDRIAIGVVVGEDSFAIYTFPPDGSGFTQVVAGGRFPYWSPDGSRIAYSLSDNASGDGVLHLAIADADGSNVREFDLGASGPWHPGILEPAR